MDLRDLSIERLEVLIQSNENKEKQLSGIMSEAFMNRQRKATEQLRKALQYKLNKN